MPIGAGYAAVFAPAAAAGAYLLLTARGRALPTLPAQALLSGATIATFLAFYVFGAGAISGALSDRDLARVAASIGPDRVVAYRVRPYSFLFYSGLPVFHEEERERYADSLVGAGPVLVLTKDKRLDEFVELTGATGLVEIARNARHVLLSTCAIAPTGGGEFDCLADAVR